MDVKAAKRAHKGAEVHETDVFVGEGAVVGHALESRLLVESETGEVESVAVGDEMGEGVPCDSVAHVQDGVPVASREGESVLVGSVAHAQDVPGLSEDSIPAYQIDASAQLSQDTLNALFGSPSEMDDKLSRRQL
ncbi:hypothetical protein PI124_g2017 [Phytophthora idaei]|nr:hypothetical protein PI125_g1603 [Phytophthora idaei]KAG3170593.1 hypothetical protein PI126_g2304 [Phytophthora idaei]KAG3253391.1 hypothetical protein PI124_g2017 [Phytophthora idaei]